MVKIQEKALNVIYNGNHSTYDELLAISKSPSLKIRRIITISVQSFKIIKKERHQYIHYLVVLNKNKCDLSYNNTAQIPNSQDYPVWIELF
jgi:hypothetical protein